MSSIPKAMKFLQVHFEALTELYQTFAGAVEKVFSNFYLLNLFSFLGHVS